jgi:hypothetical protein
MRNELQRRLVDRWPTWFNIGGDPRHTSMHFGFQHGDGWFDLLWWLCERLEPVVDAAEKETGPPFEVLQVKEKFGGLRFYATTTMTRSRHSLKPPQLSLFTHVRCAASRGSAEAVVGFRPCATSTPRDVTPTSPATGSHRCKARSRCCR